MPTRNGRAAPIAIPTKSRSDHGALSETRLTAQTSFVSPSKTAIAWVGQPCAASTILSSGCAVGIEHDRDAVVVEVEHAGRPERAVARAHARSRSIWMSSATLTPSGRSMRRRRSSARDLAEPGVAVVDGGCHAGSGRRPVRCAPSGRRRSSTSRARTRAGRGTRRRARRLREPRTRAPAARCSRRARRPTRRRACRRRSRRCGGPATGLASIMRRVDERGRLERARRSAAAGPCVRSRSTSCPRRSGSCTARARRAGTAPRSARVPDRPRSARRRAVRSPS